MIAPSLVWVVTVANANPLPRNPIKRDLDDLIDGDRLRCLKSPPFRAGFSFLQQRAHFSRCNGQTLVGDKAMARDNFTSGIVRPMILAIVSVVVAIGAATSVGDRQLSRFMQMPLRITIRLNPVPLLVVTGLPNPGNAIPQFESFR